MKIAVTGSYSYSGKYITHRLLSLGHEVITLTGHPHRPDPFSGQVKTFPLVFDQDTLSSCLKGVDLLYNTYWIRFDQQDNTQARAVGNTLALVQAARSAGVRRIVHISITNPSLDSPLPYFSGKAANEQAIKESGLSYAILRPTVLFGKEDILINNIAWLQRHFPFFGQVGDGKARLQPVFVDDLAEMAVLAGTSQENLVWDSVGPDIFTMDELVRLVGKVIGHPRPILHLPPRLALAASQAIGLFVRDVVLTSDEVAGLTAGLLVSSEHPRGRTHLGDWLKANAATVGKVYASELSRHFK